MSISDISITGTDPGDFAQTNTCGKSVAAGGSCFIKATFKPLAKGERTADVSIRTTVEAVRRKLDSAGQAERGSIAQPTMDWHGSRFSWHQGGIGSEASSPIPRGECIRSLLTTASTALTMTASLGENCKFPARSRLHMRLPRTREEKYSRPSATAAQYKKSSSFGPQMQRRHGPTYLKSPVGTQQWAQSQSPERVASLSD